MEKLTDLLKTSTIIKNEQGSLEAINYLKNLLIDRNLKEEDALRCSKKIASFIKKEKSISIDEATKFFLNLVEERIHNHEYKFEFFFSLSDFYYDKKEYELALSMLSGAISSVSPDEFLYLHKIRNCFNKIGHIIWFSMSDIQAKSKEYLYRNITACILEIASEINFSLTDKLRFYFEYRNSDFSKNIYLNDEHFNLSLKNLGLLQEKKSIISSIQKFSTFDIPRKMGFSEVLLNGGNVVNDLETYIKFDDISMIVEFVNNLLLKYQGSNSIE